MKMLFAFCAFIVSFLAQAKVGFFDPEDPEVPAAVRAASQSIYKVYHIDPVVFQNPEQLALIPAQSYTEMKRWLEEKLVHPGQQELFVDLDLALLKQCMQRRKPNCVIIKSLAPNQVLIGSAFLFQNSQTLVSAAHVFELENQLKTDRRLVLINSRNEIVFDSLNESSTYRIQTYGRTSLQPNQLSLDLLGVELGEVENDFVIIGLSTALSERPLEAARSSQAADQMIYMLGHPTRTSVRFLLGGKDSDGYGLKVTMGKCRSLEEIFAEALQNPLARELLGPGIRKYEERIVLSTDIDAAQGMSGGAVLNEEGKVLAIVSSSISATVHGDVEDSLPQLVFATRIKEVARTLQSFDPPVFGPLPR